jgi:hypothetical protein
MLCEFHVFGARSGILGIGGGRRMRDYLFHMLQQNVIVSHLEV